MRRSLARSADWNHSFTPDTGGLHHHYVLGLSFRYSHHGIIVKTATAALAFPQRDCDNGRTIRRGRYRAARLGGPPPDKLVSPEAVAVAVRAYAEETNRQDHERRAQAETSRRGLEKIERSIKGIMDAIEDGMYQPAMKAMMGELAQQKAEIKARLTSSGRSTGVHPNIAEHYRAKVTTCRNAGRAGVQRGSPRGHPLASWRGGDNPRR